MRNGRFPTTLLFVGELNNMEDENAMEFKYNSAVQGSAHMLFLIG